MSQVDKYVEEALSHVKNTIKSANKIRDATVISLKQSLRINVEEELHREEQK
jgi:energy-converting hydrogenase A subunit M